MASKRIGWAALAGLAAAAAAGVWLERRAAAPPDWAFPRGLGAPPAGGWDRTRDLALDGASAKFTKAQTKDLFKAVDWRPASHPPMPRAVAAGRPPDVAACGYCHLPAGEGRPENASLAGLPRAYIVNQVRHFADGARVSAVHGWGPSALMIDTARHATRAEVEAAAVYFSTLAFTSRLRVVESARVPTPTAMNFILVPGAGKPTQALGERIVEGPVSIERWELRDPEVSYVAYVPMGSVGRGAALAGGAGGVQACSGCHGADLRGGGVGPPLAGRSPSYLFRQLYAFKAGVRSGPDAVAMRAVTARLTAPEMIALAAFAASRKP